MKRGVAVAFLLGMLTCIGCITTRPPATLMSANAPPSLPPPLPVTPDRITPTNGHLIAQNLSDELDYEARLAVTPAP